MIDKRVFIPDYNGIRVGMLVVPVVGFGAIYAASVWVGSHENPGLVLELFHRFNPEGRVNTPTALVLVGGRRIQVGTRFIRPVPDDDTTEGA